MAVPIHNHVDVAGDVRERNRHFLAIGTDRAPHLPCRHRAGRLSQSLHLASRQPSEIDRIAAIQLLDEVPLVAGYDDDDVRSASLLAHPHARRFGNGTQPADNLSIPIGAQTERCRAGGMIEAADLAGDRNIGEGVDESRDLALIHPESLDDDCRLLVLARRLLGHSRDCEGGDRRKR